MRRVLRQQLLQRQRPRLPRALPHLQHQRALLPPRPPQSSYKAIYDTTWWSQPRLPLYPYTTRHFISSNRQYTDEEMAILDALNDVDQDTDSFQEADLVRSSGLTETQISKNLHLTKYTKDEKEEDCTICLSEFKDNETLGVLECKHQYHTRCIKKWLLQQNICPLCKREALTI